MPRIRSLSVAATLLLVPFASHPAYALWPAPLGLVSVCSAPGDQNSTVLTTDGAGGMIAAWVDTRSGNADVYAQRVDAGAVAHWGASGIPICTAANTQYHLTIVSDGAGGAYIAWEDHRNDPFNADVYAQHVNSSGSAVSGWPANGLQITTVANDQDSPMLVTDGAGGAYVGWHDYRTGGNGADVYVQRLSSGGVAAGWPANGIPVCALTGDQGPVNLAPDGAGGAYLAWHDGRNSGATGFDIYAQRVLSNATVAWTANGVLVCNAAGDQLTPILAQDGTLGVNVVWTDHRTNGTTGADLYCNYLYNNGTSPFPGNGQIVTTVTGDQINPAIVAGGPAIAFVAWEDHRADAGDIYAAKIQSGIATVNVPLCTAAGAQTAPLAVTDGAGGGIFVWSDARNGNGDVYAQRLGSNDAVQWAANGLYVSLFGNDEFYPAAVADARGGALVAFTQFYNAGANELVAERADHFGYIGSPEPVITSVTDVAADQGGLVHLVWNASFLDADPGFTIGTYNVWRQITTGAAQLALARGARLLREGEPASGGPAIRTLGAGVNATTWEFLGSVPARAYASYAFPAATLQDSTATGSHDTVFMVDAQAASGPDYWHSDPVAGHSVDNLAPNAPANLAGNYGAGATHLHWSPNTESDLNGYHVYRGASSTFTPSPANLVGAPADTGFADPGPAGSYYKLSALDVHGNESGFALLTPAQTSGVGGGAPLAFEPPSVRPNPIRDGASIRFTLPAAAPVRLELHDPQGRLVRRLIEGRVEPGVHELAWDGRDEARRALPPGLYFLRFECPLGSRVERLAIVR
ncbi:MAG TPA: FlgD immunoglobulin-like domain containing protein [Candidatus Eisenbacteria bacterium]|nr:FlgD immunoglobulin-like domain containing protein [Candidatus Eisenbacteria bacterium]